MFINLLLLSIAPFGYLYKKSYSYVLAILSWLILYPVCTLIYKIDPLNAAFPIFIFNCLLIGLARYRDIIEEVRSEWSSRLEKQEDLKRRSLEEFEKLNAVEIEIREKEIMVVKLYEITKRMSEGLKLDSVFSIFSAFLKENFIFRKSELVILKQADNDLRTDRVYNVWGEEEGHKSSEESGGLLGGNIDYNEIIKLSLKSEKGVYIARPSEEDIFKRLRIDEEAKTLALIPLLSENKMIGILTIEDLPHVDLERFSILAVQFALEIKRALLYEIVEELAITDSLTGLYVRRYFFERLSEESNRSKKYKFKFAFLMIDIDNFKNANDTYGHLVGDIILKDVGRLMKESVREIDLVARYGGEEFSLVLPETGKEDARLVGERIRKKIEECIFRAYDEKLKVTVSIGISVYPDDSIDLKSLIEKADRALYVGKKAGKNVVCAYEK